MLVLCAKRPKTSWQTEKTPNERRFGETLKRAQILPFSKQYLKYHPIPTERSIKNSSIWPRKIVPGYLSWLWVGPREGIWKRRYSDGRSDLEKHGTASEIYSRRIIAKEIIMSRIGGNFSNSPNRRRHGKIAWKRSWNWWIIFEGSVNLQEVKIFAKNFNGARIGSSTSKKPKTDPEAPQRVSWSDWSFKGESGEVLKPTENNRWPLVPVPILGRSTVDFICRHHVEPRVSPPCAERVNPEKPLKYIGRDQSNSHKSGCDARKNVPAIVGMLMGIELCQIRGTGFTKFRNPLPGNVWSRWGAWHRSKQLPDQIICGPGIWIGMPDGSQKSKKKQEWAIEKAEASTMLENWEGYISLHQKMKIIKRDHRKNARKKTTQEKPSMLVLLRAHESTRKAFGVYSSEKSWRVHRWERVQFSYPVQNGA